MKYNFWQIVGLLLILVGAVVVLIKKTGSEVNTNQAVPTTKP